MEMERLKPIVEAAIMVAEKPLNLDQLTVLFDEFERPDKQGLRQVIAELQHEYAERGVELVEVASGFRFQAAKQVAPWVSRLWQEKAPRYSRAVMETLALIAYRQPITRGEIEDIRGVAVSSQIMKGLLERQWVRMVGHRDVAGRPALYATTSLFLDYFGLKSLDELPTLAEIRDLDAINAELIQDELPLAARPTFGSSQPENRSLNDGPEDIAETQESDAATDLIDMSSVDSVLSNFEAEFRRPAPSNMDEGTTDTDVTTTETALKNE